MKASDRRDADRRPRRPAGRSAGREHRPWPSRFHRHRGFAQHLDRSLPAELRFRDERGHAVRLGDYLGTARWAWSFPTIGCSNLCPMQIRNLAQRLAQTSGAAADQAQMLVVSIDPLDTPALADQAKHKFLDDLLPAPIGPNAGIF